MHVETGEQTDAVKMGNIADIVFLCYHLIMREREREIIKII